MIIGIDAKALSKPRTGIAVYIREVVRHMQKLEENTYYLLSNADFDLPAEWKNCKKIIYKTKLPGSLAVCFYLDKMILDLGIELFWGPEHCIPVKKTVYKKVVTIHDLSVVINPNWGTYYNSFFQRLMVKKCVNAADKCIAISKSTRNDVIHICKETSERVAVIYNGDSPYKYEVRNYSNEFRFQLQKEFGIKKNYYLYCGTIEPRKNIETIVRAFDKYRKDNPQKDEQMVLCGGLGWKYRGILDTIAKAKYKSDVIMAGYASEDVKEYLYRNAIAVIFPSHYEGLGLPVLEGMSCGVPVITARNSSLEEIGGDVALYVDDENDYCGIAKLMNTIVGYSLEERKRMSMKCKEHASNFSREKCARETLELFRGICNAKHSQKNFVKNLLDDDGFS